MQRPVVVKVTNIINAAIRLKHVPSAWKVSEVIMLPKVEVDSNRPISLLPIMSKLFEKLIAKRLHRILDKYCIIPSHQFGFRRAHSTIDQIHRITDVIEKALEEGAICSALLLDIAQAFDRVWHEGLLFKIKELLPREYFALLTSYLHGRKFRVRNGNDYSMLKSIRAGVPQGSVLGPMLYLLYVNDIPKTANTMLATFADDTAIMSTSNSIEDSVSRLQMAAGEIVCWSYRWRIKLNESKSTFINFTKNTWKKATFS